MKPATAWTQIQIVLNWFEELQARVPTGQGSLRFSA